MVLPKIRANVLEEMFPKRLTRNAPAKEIYAQLKDMIITGKLKKGDKVIQEKMPRDSA